MRIVLIGVSHWHTPFYLDPLLTMPDMSVIGVSDPDTARANEIAAKARCPGFDDYREMCARLKPDFAFALGRHCDMAEEARFLIAERIPFAMEKPCAITAADAHDIAARAAQANLFAAVPFVIRYSPLIDTIREVAADEAVNYIVFKFVGGMVDRYHEQHVPGCCIAPPPEADRCSIWACTSSISAACCCRTRSCTSSVRRCRTASPNSTSRITRSC